MRRALPLIVVAATLALAGTAASGSARPAATAARTVSVKVGDNYYVRPRGVPTLRVRRGTVVRWVWRGRQLHDVAVASGPTRFRSSLKTRGSFRKRVTRRGTYVIYCTIHGRADMSMRLRVR
jgi:plastocyanin